MNDQPESIDDELAEAARLTARVLGELKEKSEGEWREGQRDECEEIERIAAALLKPDRTPVLPASSAELRAAVEAKLSSDATLVELHRPAGWHQSRGRWVVALSAGLLLLLFAVAVSNSLTNNLLPRSLAVRFENAKRRQQNAVQRVELERAERRLAVEQAERRFASSRLSGNQADIVVSAEEVAELRQEIRLAQQNRDSSFAIPSESESQIAAIKAAVPESVSADIAILTSPQPALPGGAPLEATPDYVMPPDAGVEVFRTGNGLGAQAVPSPNQLAAGPVARGAGNAVAGESVRIRGRSTAEKYAVAGEAKRMHSTTYAGGYGIAVDGREVGQQVDQSEYRRLTDEFEPGLVWNWKPSRRVATEQYTQIVENRFASVKDEPLSTFSIDVDTASYANARRFLTQNRLPPANAIRIEEFINYFRYDYPAPEQGEPFSVNMEVAQCPWQPAHQLVRIGLKGKEVPQAERPASNIVFLLDVSGSMQDENKLPLLKQAMKMLTDQLTESDRVSIVTYAGNAGLVLETTNGENKQTIRDAIDALQANGSTNGSAGIQLAYEQATQSFIKAGANRVILATDGDLNVGVTDDDALVELIKAKAASGVFLTVLGFGQGNLKDGKLEKLADNGNGMYAYIDSLREARKVLVEQIAGSLVTIAKDVKIKVEFNPAEVAAYRLLGYENRLMSAPDFDNDAKDAGEIGAGHTVTALYELVPASTRERLTSTGLSLKYQRSSVANEPPKELTAAAETGELLTLFLRYKWPDANDSTLSEFAVANQQRAFDDASADLRFAAAVASFAMVLRNSEFRGNSSLADVEQIASSAIADDPQGHRTEFLDLVRKAGTLPALGR